MPIATDKLVDSKDIANTIQDILNQLDTKVSKTGNETIDGIKTFNDTIKVKNLQVTNSGKSVTPADNSNSTDIATTEWVKRALGEFGTYQCRVKIDGDTSASYVECWYYKLGNGIMLQWGTIPVKKTGHMTLEFKEFVDSKSYVIFKNYPSGNSSVANDYEVGIYKTSSKQGRTYNNKEDLAETTYPGGTKFRGFYWFAIGIGK